MSGVTKSRLTMLPKLELHRGSSMEISSGTRVDIRKRWKKDWDRRYKDWKKTTLKNKCACR